MSGLPGCAALPAELQLLSAVDELATQSAAQEHAAPWLVATLSINIYHVQRTHEELLVSAMQ